MGVKSYHYSCFDKTKPKPNWLCVQGLRNDVSWRYWIRVWNAQPVWADTDRIKEIYRRAAKLRDEGFNAVVDHEIPLNGKDICGLHVPDNLQIITGKYNSQISNHTYPGQPYEQFDMIGVPVFLKRPWGEQNQQFDMFGVPLDNVK